MQTFFITIADDNASIKALKVVYSDMFGEMNRNFITENIDVSSGSWLNDLGEIIPEDYLGQIRLEINDEKKSILITTFLIQQNDISTYKTLLSIWKLHNPSKAEQFEYCLMKEIDKQGLKAIDEGFQSRSEYIILIKIAHFLFSYIKLGFYANVKFVFHYTLVTII